MQRWSLSYYNDTYLLLNVTPTVVGQGVNDVAAAPDRNSKQVVFKNYAPITSYINGINNTQVDSATDFNIVTPMYNLVEYSKNYAKISGRVLQDHKVVPSKSITKSELFKFKSNLTNNTGNAGTANAEIAVSWKYLSVFLESPWSAFD